MSVSDGVLEKADGRCSAVDSSSTFGSATSAADVFDEDITVEVDDLMSSVELTAVDDDGVSVNGFVAIVGSVVLDVVLST